MTALASRADITLDLGILGTAEAIVLYRDADAPRLTAVYVQFGEHLLNVLSRMAPEGEAEILGCIYSEDDPAPVSTDPDDLLAELGETP